MKKLSALFIALAFLVSGTCISLADTGTTNSQIQKDSSIKKHTPKKQKPKPKHQKKTAGSNKTTLKTVKD